jgi:hypothetical protein
MNVTPFNNDYASKFKIDHPIDSRHVRTVMLDIMTDVYAAILANIPQLHYPIFIILSTVCNACQTVSFKLNSGRWRQKR